VSSVSEKFEQSKEQQQREQSQANFAQIQHHTETDQKTKCPQGNKTFQFIPPGQPEETNR